MVPQLFGANAPGLLGLHHGGHGAGPQGARQGQPVHARPLGKSLGPKLPGGGGGAELGSLIHTQPQNPHVVWSGCPRALGVQVGKLRRLHGANQRKSPNTCLLPWPKTFQSPLSLAQQMPGLETHANSRRPGRGKLWGHCDFSSTCQTGRADAIFTPHPDRAWARLHSSCQRDA